jgi:hypothetical protein
MIGGVIGGELAAAPSQAPNFEELQGSPEEDLFLYSRKDVTLAHRSVFASNPSISGCRNTGPWSANKPEDRATG